MPSSRINKSVKFGYQKTITDPDHPDYLTKCPLPIRVKLAGKQLFNELLDFFQFEDQETMNLRSPNEDWMIEKIVKKHAIPLPIQVLEYTRSMFMTQRLNPAGKNEGPGIQDIVPAPITPDIFNETDDIVKHCIDLLNKRIDG